MSAPVPSEPFTGSLPLQPPDALQAVAFVEDQVSVAVPPFDTVVGAAVKMTVGAGLATVTVADREVLPPAPLQVSV